jgi:uncharacterized protein (TIGR00369 family)
MRYSPMDENFETRIRASFEKQGIMHTIGGRLLKVEPGEVQIELPFSEALTQQHGFIHAGILTTIVDSACGYAASTLMPSESEVLTVEYKVNFISPAKGEKFLAIGRVVKPGRSLTVCRGEVLVQDGSEYKTVVLMQTTMMTILR